jgi:hypothetical protein
MINLKTATAAEIEAHIETLETKLTNTVGYTPSSGVVTFALEGQARTEAERELAQARHVFLLAAKAREVAA